MKNSKIAAAVLAAVLIIGSFATSYAAAPPNAEIIELEECVPSGDIPRNEENVKGDGYKTDPDKDRATEFDLMKAASVEPIAVSNYYGRTAMSKLASSEKMLYLYDEISNSIATSKSKVEIDSKKYGVSIDEYKTALNAVLYDYPQYFWYDFLKTYSYTYSGGKIMSVNLNYIDFENLSSAKDTFEKTAEEVIKCAKITSSMSDYEKAKRLHDVLIGWVSYDHDAAQSGASDVGVHTAYQAIVNHRAVCDGYAKAYQYLLYECGILSHIVTGCATSGGGAYENHAWNIVWLNGKTYYVDVTWDDASVKNSDSTYRETGISYGYFNINSEMLAKDHIINKSCRYDSASGNYLLSAIDNGYELPSCTSLDENYYKKDGIWLTSENINDDKIFDSVAKKLISDVKVRIYYDSDVSFISWINNNLQTIYNKYCNELSKSPKVTPYVNYTSNEAGIVFFDGSNNIKVTKDFEVIVNNKNNPEGKLCQMIYNDDGVGSYFDTVDVSGDNYFAVMLYPYKGNKNIECSKARYMCVDFSNFSPLLEKAEINY